MEHTGLVIESQNGMLTVAVERPGMCSNCAGCLDKRCTQIEVAGQADPGDTVVLSLPEKGMASLSALVYGIPILLLIVGLLVGQAIYPQLDLPMDINLFSALCGFALLLVSFGILKGVDAMFTRSGTHVPRVVSVSKPVR